MAATYNSLHYLDADLTIRSSVSHGLMIDLHEIHATALDRVVVTSTSLDAVIEYDTRTGHPVRSYWPREMPRLRERLRLAPLAVDKGADHRRRPSAGTAGLSVRLGRRALSLLPRRWRPARMTRSHWDDTHPNAVVAWRGHAVALLARLGVIVDLDAEKILVEDPHLKGAHNLALLPDGTTIIANDTRGRTVRSYDLPTGRLIRTITIREHDWIRELERVSIARLGQLRGAAARVEGIWNQFVTPLQLRGLATDSSRIWVGMSPTAVACFDHTGRFESGFIDTTDLRQRVNCLAIGPSGTS